MIIIYFSYRYRPSSHKFPIIISQDCDNIDVYNALQAFNTSITYIKVCKHLKDVCAIIC